MTLSDNPSTETMEENPFPELKVSPSSFLDEASGRSACSNCGKSRKYYCYNCFMPMPQFQERWPQVKLPVKVTILKHPNEIDGKSTAAQVATMAPDHVTVYTYPQIPDFEDPSKVVLVFPGNGALTFDEFVRKNCSRRCVDTSTNQRGSKEEVTHSVASTSVDVLCEAKQSNRTPGDCEAQLSQKESESTEISKENITSQISDDCNCKQAESETKLLSARKIGDVEENGTERTPSECGASISLEPTTSGVKRKLEASPFVPLKKPSSHELWQADGLQEVVFIDSTWYQVHHITKDQRLQDLQRIELKSRKTHFWRHQQDKPDTYLSTAEAIYYFMREYHNYFIDSEYDGEYDDLLFLFCFMYHKIRHLYDGGKNLKAYKQGKKAS